MLSGMIEMEMAGPVNRVLINTVYVMCNMIQLVDSLGLFNSYFDNQSII